MFITNTLAKPREKIIIFPIADSAKIRDKTANEVKDHIKGLVVNETIEEIAKFVIDFKLYLDWPLILFGLEKYTSATLNPTKGTWTLKTRLFSFNFNTSFKARRSINLKFATLFGIFTFLESLLTVL